MSRYELHSKPMQPSFGELAFASAADAKRNAKLVFSFMPASIEQLLVSYCDQIYCGEHTVFMDYSAGASSN